LLGQRLSRRLQPFWLSVPALVESGRPRVRLQRVLQVLQVQHQLAEALEM